MESPRQSGGVQAGAKDSVASKDSVENETSEKDSEKVPCKEGNANTSSTDGGGSIIHPPDQTTEVTHAVTHVGTAARLTPPPPSLPHVPPSVSAAQPGRSILRRHSAYGNGTSTKEKNAADDSESSDTAVEQEGESWNRKPAPTSAASAASGSESLQVAAAATFPPSVQSRRQSLLGVSYNGETAPLLGRDEGPPAAVATTTTIRRHSLLGVSYNGETAPLAGGTSSRRHSIASIASISSASTSASGSASSRTTTTPRRHSMLGVAYSGMATELVGRDTSTANSGNGGIQGSASWESPPRNVTRRHSMLGVSYGGMTAPLELSGDDGKAARHDAPSNPMPNPNRAHRRLSMPRTTQSRAEQQRRLSIPPAEVGSASRETIGRISRSHSLAHSSTSSVIDQTQRRPSLTEIQDFLDDENDDDDGNGESDDEVDLGGDGERRLPSSLYNKAERKLSMPRAEIGAQSRETMRSTSLTTKQIETRRLSLTEVQDYLDGDSSSDDEEEDGGQHSEENAARANANNSQSRRHSIASVSSQVSQQPRSILRRHSSYGSNVPTDEVPQYVRPDLIRMTCLHQQTASPSAADGNEAPRDRSASIGSAGSSVSFGSVSIRSHSQTLGDHPCCKLGPPMALDWKYQDHRPVRVDDWEKYRVREGGPNSEMMYIPPGHRRNVLEYRYGHSREETTEAARVARMARRRRSMTRTMLPMAGIEEAGETVAGFAKKVVKSGRQVVTKKKKANRRDSAHF